MGPGGDPDGDAARASRRAGRAGRRRRTADVRLRQSSRRLDRARRRAGHRARLRGSGGERDVRDLRGPRAPRQRSRDRGVPAPAAQLILLAELWRCGYACVTRSAKVREYRIGRVGSPPEGRTEDRGESRAKGEEDAIRNWWRLHRGDASALGGRPARRGARA